jgi:hypothetical protein
MKTPKIISNLSLDSTFEGISMRKWETKMEGTVKANGGLIRKHIKDYLPELYECLALQFYNPYESQCVKKEGLLVYVHSGIEYFLKYS